MQTSAAQLDLLNPRLIPLIAHDRAGFGGGVCSGGLALLIIAWRGVQPGAIWLWRTLCLTGTVAFATAIGVHPVIGYASLSHLAPAYLGAVSYIASLSLLHAPLCDGETGASAASEGARIYGPPPSLPLQACVLRLTITEPD